MGFLERLREKPKEARVRVAFVTAFVVTALIALLWVVSLSVRFNTPEESTDSEPSDSERELNNLIDLTKSQFDALKNDETEVDEGTQEVLIGTSTTRKSP